MTEVTINNFEQILPELKEIINKSKFFSIDLEFSCLTATSKVENSIFDSPKERYRKLKETVQQMIPLQIGLSCFLFEPDLNAYTAHAFTFYVFPKSFQIIDTKFLCSAASFQFLTDYNFDFNMCFREGISFLNRSQEELLLKHQKSLLPSNSVQEAEQLLSRCKLVVNEWFKNAKTNEELHLTDVDVYKSNLEIPYFLHNSLRKCFKYLWTFENSKRFTVRKVTLEEFKKLEYENNLNELLMSKLLGFTKVFRMLCESQKPIIGHNLLVDLLIIVDKFENRLPKSYEGFKKLIHSLFPSIYDTKCLSYDLRRSIPEQKRFDLSSLESLYDYFKNGYGRHLAPNSPLIQPHDHIKENFHCAGWDSYCTGYIFIRMAHIYAFQSSNSVRKTFMSRELLQAVVKFENSINIIRGNLSHIQLDGSDPISTRPPWLIVETIKNKPININEITSLFATYGFVEIKPLSFRRHRAIVAVDNFGSARRILREFNGHSDFTIQQYSVLKHSPYVRTAMWGGFLVSSALLAWFGYSKIK